MRRECFDFLIPLSANYVRWILREWVPHYNTSRPHMSLGPGMPQPPTSLPVPLQAHRHQLPEHLPVVSQPILGGLHHAYALAEKVKEPQKLPRALVADEKLTQVARQQVDVPTPVGGGCFLGVSVVEAADTATVERGYGACAKEAKTLVPAYQVRSVCTDGWEAMRQAWRQLFPLIKMLLCLLHAILKMKQHCAGQLRHQVLTGLAGLSGGDQTAVCPASEADGCVDTGAPQRSCGHDGVEEVSPSGRLHPRL